MRIFLTIFLIIAASQTIASGDQSTMPNQCSQTVSKGRSLLLDKFIENDPELVKKVKNYLIEKGKEENCIALYPREHSLILYSTQEYAELINNIKLFETNRKTKLDSIKNLNRPIPDVLYKKLKQKSSQNNLAIKKQLINSNLDDETAYFLTLHFEQIINQMPKDSLITLANNFLSKYPDSQYKNLIKNNEEKIIPKDYKINGDISDIYNIFINEFGVAIKVLFF